MEPTTFELIQRQRAAKRARLEQEAAAAAQGTGEQEADQNTTYNF